MKKYGMIIACVCLTLNLLGCAAEEAQTQERDLEEYGTRPEEEEVTGIPSSAEEMEEKDGILVELPSGLINAEWLRYPGDPVICEVRFEYEGKKYRYRTCNCDGYRDISGMEETWDSTNIDNVEELNSNICLTDEGKGALLWYDTRMHAICMDEGATAETLTAMYDRFYPSDRGELTAPENVVWGCDASRLPDAGGINASWLPCEQAESYEAVLYMRWNPGDPWEETDRKTVEEPSVSFFFQDYGDLKLEIYSVRENDKSEPLTCELLKKNVDGILAMSNDSEAEAAGDPPETAPLNGTLSDEELCKLVADYYERKTGVRPPIVEIDSEESDMVSVHLYEDMGDHTATWDWYMINRVTLKGTNILEEEIDLNEVLPADTQEE